VDAPAWFVRTSARTTIARLVQGERTVQAVDLAESEAYREGSSQRRAVVDVGGFRTILSIALHKDNVLLGALHVYRKEARPFSNKQIALLENFAAQAVIAMENARLLTETREALEQQTATAEVLQVINSSPGDLAPVFDAMLDNAIRLCDTAFGIMQTYDGEAFPVVALRGAPPALAEVISERELFKPRPGTVAARIVAGETVIRTTDLREEPHYLAGARPARALVELGAARSFACIALRKDNALLGALTVYRTEIRPFTDKQIALLQNFAAQAVIAMENARLLTETREALEQQTATAEVLRVISGSPTDVQPTFDAIAANATILSGAAAGVVYRFDGSLIHFVANYGLPRDVLQAVQRSFPCPPGRQTTARDPDAGGRAHP
jgi:GAF domain-containing protein